MSMISEPIVCALNGVGNLLREADALPRGASARAVEKPHGHIAVAGGEVRLFPCDQPFILSPSRPTSRTRCPRSSTLIHSFRLSRTAEKQLDPAFGFPDHGDLNGSWLLSIFRASISARPRKSGRNTTRHHVQGIGILPLAHQRL